MLAPDTKPREATFDYDDETARIQLVLADSLRQVVDIKTPSRIMTAPSMGWTPWRSRIRTSPICRTPWRKHLCAARP